MGSGLPTTIFWVMTHENKLTFQSSADGGSKTSNVVRADLTGRADVPVVARIFSEEGSLLAEAINVREADSDPTGHAEIVAIRKAGRVLGDWRLEGLTLFSSLEPCLMCSSVIREARLSRVLFGIPSDSPTSDLYDILRDPRIPGPIPEVIRVSGDSVETEPDALRVFFKKVRST